MPCLYLAFPTSQSHRVLVAVLFQAFCTLCNRAVLLLTLKWIALGLQIISWQSTPRILSRSFQQVLLFACALVLNVWRETWSSASARADRCISTTEKYWNETLSQHKYYFPTTLSIISCTKWRKRNWNSQLCVICHFLLCLKAQDWKNIWLKWLIKVSMSPCAV